MPLQFKHEKSVENLFKDNFEAAARDKEYEYTSASLDSQDRLVGADYLFTNHNVYAIIEFKYRESDLPSEVKKEKRLHLCHALHKEKQVRALHETCHFAAWSNTSPITIETNIYYNEVCNKQFWGTQFDKNLLPDTTTRKSENVFIDLFLDGKEGGNFDAFNTYIKWLITLGDANNNTGYLELLISNPLNRRAAGLEFTSVENMKKWIDLNMPKQKLTVTPKNR
ncbi:hypothetical protein [Pseudomonas sp. dw_612]|uniref:hypothetical protein n=1 Tax=Pseudomonas sp. dw_612 TaxID=2720080 RepID=UPI001BD69E17|nr:hypothetical protein [Pseudomonas sp. dw_612]